MPAVLTAELFFPSRQPSRLDVLDVEEATGAPRLTAADAFGSESRNGLLCAGDPVNRSDPFGLLDGGASNTMLPPGYRPNVGSDPVGNIIGVTLGVVTFGPFVALVTEPLWLPALVFAGTPQGQQVINKVNNFMGGYTPGSLPTNGSQWLGETANALMTDLRSPLLKAIDVATSPNPTGRTESSSFDLNPGSPFSVFGGSYNMGAGFTFEWIGASEINVDGDITREPGFYVPSGRGEGSSAGGMSLGGYGAYGSSTAAAAGWEASWSGGSNSPLSQITQHRKTYKLN